MGFIGVQLLLLVVARAKAANKKGRPWASGRFGNLAIRVTSGELTLVWLCVVGLLVLVLMRGHQLRTDEKLAELEKINNEKESPWSKTVFGYPPMPIRPDHPKQVAGTYYRGNCERNKELFNNGNYLTATFRVNLCDAEGNVIGEGDPIPADGLYVYVEIERAPGTPDMLFDSRMMSTVFFSETFYDPRGGVPPGEKPTQLEAVEEGQRWGARIPIRKKLQGDSLAGLIYLYMGQVHDGVISGEVSYAIKYDLVVTDNHLDAESDLWMSAFCVPNIAEPLRPANCRSPNGSTIGRFRRSPARTRKTLSCWACRNTSTRVCSHATRCLSRRSDRAAELLPRRRSGRCARLRA